MDKVTKNTELLLVVLSLWGSSIWEEERSSTSSMVSGDAPLIPMNPHRAFVRQHCRHTRPALPRLPLRSRTYLP